MARLAAIALGFIAPLSLASPASIPRDVLSSESVTLSGGPCTSASNSSFAWTVSNATFHASYVFSTPAHQNSWGYIDFNLTNPALGLTTSCSGASSRLNDFFYGETTYTCSYMNGTTPKFTFSRPGGTLSVNQTWTCYDGPQPEYPITFFAAGTVNLTQTCDTTTYQNDNWTLGQIYSDREVRCAPQTVDLRPYMMTAVA